ncbi:MAG: beta-galactosidase, partial [Oryzihumus sp.]
MRAWPDDRIAFGGDYNPEQWPRETWAQDMALMREAGVSFVTLGVFSWSWLEPAPGEYEFGWLDEAMDLLHEAGVAIDLATATATPPPWLSAAHPEILPVDHDGHTLWPGSRQAWCPSSPVYREHALALTTQLARRYHDHPALALWHVSNEYACHNLPCYCDTCAAGFRQWLQARYGDLARLNDAWGTAFWSQRYSAWEQVLPPRATLSSTNPGQTLDFDRFSSDERLGHHRAEAAVLRELSDKHVTTNFLVAAHITALDYWTWTGDMDVIANDHYL